MIFFDPRLIAAALCAAVLVFSGPLAVAQNAEVTPAEQARDTAKESQKDNQKVNELAEAARALNGPAGNAECVWLGRRVVSLLWRDDLDTARHLDLYDRFG
jgi:hypothetical protein